MLTNNFLEAFNTLDSLNEELTAFKDAAKAANDKASPTKRDKDAEQNN